MKAFLKSRRRGAALCSRQRSRRWPPTRSPGAGTPAVRQRHRHSVPAGYLRIGPDAQGHAVRRLPTLREHHQRELRGRQLVLDIEHYLTTITAQLEGRQAGRRRRRAEPREPRGVRLRGRTATSEAAPRERRANAPSIAGVWEIPLERAVSKGEKAFRFIVKQKGRRSRRVHPARRWRHRRATAARFKDGKWVLSHFDGSRPA